MIPLIALGLLVFMFVAIVIPATKPVYSQAYYYTPTARPDGRIIYIVKSDDNCMRIALLNGISEQQLRQLNNLTDLNCVIQPSQELLIGIVTPEAQTTPTPTVSGPTPTLPAGGYGEVCVLLFSDINGNGVRDDTESALAGGQASVADRVGVFRNDSTVAEICSRLANGPPCVFQTFLKGITMSAWASLMDIMPQQI